MNNKKKLRVFRKKVVSWLLKPVELLVVWLATAVLPRLSRKAILAMSRFMGGCAIRFAGRDNRHMRANLELVYGKALTEAECRRMMRAVWNHASLVLLDFFWFLKDTHARIEAYVEVEPEVLKLCRETTGCMGISGHVGNWEMVSHVLCEKGRKVTSVFAPLRASKTTQKRLLSSRSTTGQTLVSKQGAARQLIRGYRNGEVVGLLLDQYTRVNDGGMFVKILGVSAPISTIGGVLHARLKCPIHVMACIHTGEGHYRVFHVAHLAGDVVQTEAETTHWIADRLSELISTYPEQWLWMYRRWRHIEPGTDPLQYPYYAHSFNPLFD